MKFYLIRHGETTANTGENNNHQPMPLPNPVIPLTEKGKQQAKQLSEFLNQYVYSQGIEAQQSVILTSSFLRTKMTAEPFIADNPHILVMEDHAIVEVNYGAIEFSYLRGLYEEEEKYYHYCREVAGEFFTRPPLGETPHDIAIRIRQFLPTFTAEMERKGIEHVFLFGHGVTNKVIIMELLKETPAFFEKDAFALNTSVRLIDNGQDAGWIYLNPLEVEQVV